MTIDKNEKVILVCRKKEEIIEETFMGLTLIEAQEKASETGFSLSYTNKTNNNDMAEKVAAMTVEEKGNWVVAGTEDVYGEKEAELELLYTGMADVPDVTFTSLDIAIETLEGMGFSDVKYESDNGTSIYNQSNWIVLSQSKTAGESVSAADTIELICQSYEDYGRMQAEKSRGEDSNAGEVSSLERDRSIRRKCC